MVLQDLVVFNFLFNMIVEYNEGLMKWFFVFGMEVMCFNFVYQILVGEVGLLFYQGVIILLNFEFVSDGMGSNLLFFMFVDFIIWLIDFFVYFFSMVIILMLKFGGEISLDEGDWVVVYVNGECWGVVLVSFVLVLNVYWVLLFVYGVQVGEMVEFFMYDVSMDWVYLAVQ